MYDSDEFGDGYGSNEFARSHAFQAQVALNEGRIGKGEAIDKAKKFVKNGLSAVIIGNPVYSTIDSVIGYKWHLVFVGNDSDVKKFIDSFPEEVLEECQMDVIK